MRKRRNLRNSSSELSLCSIRSLSRSLRSLSRSSALRCSRRSIRKLPSSRRHKRERKSWLSRSNDCNLVSTSDLRAASPDEGVSGPVGAVGEVLKLTCGLDPPFPPAGVDERAVGWLGVVALTVGVGQKEPWNSRVWKWR